MYLKALLVFLGIDIAIALIIRLGPSLGISPYVGLAFAMVTTILSIGCIPLLFLLSVAVVTTQDDVEAKSENLKRCGFLFLLAILGLVPVIVLLVP